MAEFDDDDMMMLDGTEFDDPVSPSKVETSTVLGALGLKVNQSVLPMGSLDDSSDDEGEHSSSHDDTSTENSHDDHNDDAEDDSEENYEQVCGVLQHLCQLLEECKEDVNYCIQANPVLPGLSSGGSPSSSKDAGSSAGSLIANALAEQQISPQSTNEPAAGATQHASKYYLISKWLFLCEGSPQDSSSVVGVTRLVHVLAKELGIHQKKIDELIKAHKDAAREEELAVRARREQAEKRGEEPRLATPPSSGTYANLKPYTSFARCSAALFLRVLAAIAKLEAREFSALVAVKYCFLDPQKNLTSSSGGGGGGASTGGSVLGRKPVANNKRKAGAGVSNTNASIVAVDASCEVDIVGANGLRWYKVRIGKGTVTALIKGLQRLRSEGAHSVVSTAEKDADDKFSSSGAGRKHHRRFLDLLDPGLARMRRYADDPTLNGCPFGMFPELVLVVGEKPPREVVKVLHKFDVQILVLQLPSPFKVVETQLRQQQQEKETVTALMAAAALDAEVEQLNCDKRLLGDAEKLTQKNGGKLGTSPMLTARSLSASPPDQGFSNMLGVPEAGACVDDEAEDQRNGGRLEGRNSSTIIHEVHLVPKRGSPTTTSALSAASVGSGKSAKRTTENEAIAATRSLLGVDRLIPTVINFDVTALVAVCCDMCNGAAGYEFPGHKVLNQQSTSESEGQEACIPIFDALERFSRIAPGAVTNTDNKTTDSDIDFLRELPQAIDYFPKKTTRGPIEDSVLTGSHAKLGAAIEKVCALFEKRTTGATNSSTTARLNWAVIESAWKEFCWILETLAGAAELLRASVLARMVIIIPDAIGGPEALRLLEEGERRKQQEEGESHVKPASPMPAPAGIEGTPSAVMFLRDTAKVQLRHKMIFGVADTIRGITVTANRQFVHAALDQGVSICVAFHPSRSLTEQKRMGDEAPSDVRRKAMEQRKERQRNSK